MDINGKLSENFINKGNKLPAEIVGRFLQNLSVGDRLKSERVSPLWKRTLKKWGWIDQRKLNARIVFDGTNGESRAPFWINLDDGTCHLVSLLRVCAPWLRELDLSSFGGGHIDQFHQQIARSLRTLKKLEKLDIRGLLLQAFIYNLPPTLCELKTSERKISVETLQTLSHHCPNLEEVPFRNIENGNNLETETIVELIAMFPSQKKLSLALLNLRTGEVGALAPIGQLEALEELDFWHSDIECLDGVSLGAIVEGCQRLRWLRFWTESLTEGDLFQLAKLANLTVLRVFDQYGKFSDPVLKAIAKRGQLKELEVICCFYQGTLTDNSLEHVLDRCKSLVSLKIRDCEHITERSLDAVSVEVRRRHGWPPRALPTDDQDKGIFHFLFERTGIDGGRRHASIPKYAERKLRNAHQRIGDNPWLRISNEIPDLYNF